MKIFRMRILLVLIVFLMASCAVQHQWVHESFSEPPQMKLAQAKAICEGSALNAANSVAVINPTAILVNQYKSCMASNGWSAELREVHSQAPIMHGEMKGTESAYEACISTRENKVVKCQYSDGTVEEPICDCRVNGGRVK